MKLYFAGSNENLDRVLIEMGVTRRLLSYHYHKNSTLFEKYDDIFLDSGAYSAMETGAQIDIDEYCNWLQTKKNGNVRYYASLDVIGEAEQSLYNQRYIERKGLHPVPTFHQYEPWDYLERYCRDYNFIALGGMASDKNRITEFLDGCFHIISKHWPKKVHSFGMTNFKLLYRYPFYSADSTSWQSMARYGSSRILDKHTARYRARTQHYTDATRSEVEHALKQEEMITKLWKKRGITWENL